jgi:hypothetical protein
MRRTSTALHIMNAMLWPTAHSKHDPDAAFTAILHRALHAANRAAPTAADRDFVDDMRFLLGQFATVDGLTPMGWASARGDIEARLTNYFRVQRLCDMRAIAGEVIERPLVVVGLPRTATTLTHRLLARAHGLRGPMLWELMHTDLELAASERQRVVGRIDRAMRTVQILAPAMRVIHPQRAEQPDECPFLLPHGHQHLARALMPAYQRWLTERDYTRDYRYLKQALQVLQYQRPKARWVIKSPTHLDQLPALFTVFPDAELVWTHRDPVTVMGSICSLIETAQLLHVRRPDLHGIGRMCLEVLSRMTDRARTPSVVLGMLVLLDPGWLPALLPQW